MFATQIAETWSAALENLIALSRSRPSHPAIIGNMEFFKVQLRPENSINDKNVTEAPVRLILERDAPQFLFHSRRTQIKTRKTVNSRSRHKEHLSHSIGLIAWSKKSSLTVINLLLRNLYGKLKASSMKLSCWRHHKEASFSRLLVARPVALFKVPHPTSAERSWRNVSDNARKVRLKDVHGEERH